MAVGFVDGSLVLYRGDITRERNSKQKLLRDSSSIVTGLAFKTSSSNIFLFLATDSSVIVYNITHKDKDQKVKIIFLVKNNVNIQFIIIVSFG